ncbi:MAG: 50S ribosomal protein L25/general stress protein Ctc [Micrococcales bacterium]|nr:50S ribosomal protein L25/general stress protein Ctc [Micrococcales bacterium]
MSDTTKLVAQTRTEFGKGAARRIRRAHQIPAVLYGHGTDPIHLALPGHATMMALKLANAVVEIDLDGKVRLALVKDVQRDPIKPIIEHVDLIAVRRGEKVIVDISVHVVGDAAPETIVSLDAQTVSVVAEATAIPENVEVSVEGLRAGTQILASHLKLPRGVELDVDPETLVVNVTQAESAEAVEAELAEAEAEAGIEREESDDESSGDASGESSDTE